MKKLLALLMALLMLPLAAFAESCTLGEDVTGEFIWPEGASDADALYIYRCRYPQLAEGPEGIDVINGVFQYLITDAVGFECPMNATAMQPGDPALITDISYEVTHHSAEYLSIKIIKRVTWDGDTDEIISAYTFPLTGDTVGLAANLPNLLGILDVENADEWYRDRQIAKADSCARELVWAMLEDGDVPLLDGLTEEDFEWLFYPEEDFYLNENGDLVFFLQEGLLTPEEYGVILCPIPLETLLDEI